MKVVLALEHETIPPIFDLRTLNPNIDFDGAVVKVVRDLTEWSSDKVRRASVNSFGYGDANGHCILDHVRTLFPDYIKAGVCQKQAPFVNGSANGRNNDWKHKSLMNGFSYRDHNDRKQRSSSDSPTNGPCNDQKPKSSINGSMNVHRNGQPLQHCPVKKSPEMTRIAEASTRQMVLLLFAAHNKESLDLNMSALCNTIDHFLLADVAYTLGTKRSRLPQRTFRVVNKDDPAEGLRADGQVLRSPLQPGGVAFVFTGQGAQWPAMGAQLFEYHLFRTTIAYLDHVLSSLPAPPEWSLTDILSGESDPELIHSVEISQTACTALQLGLVDLLALWSVRPVAVAGHSSGEIAAAYASGRLTAAEAIVVAYFRGQAVARNKQKGLMLAVGLGPVQIFPYLARWQEKINIAAFNSPGSVTLSGNSEAVEELSKILDKDGVFNRALKTGDNAYHSHHMLPLGHEYNVLLSKGFAHVQKLGLVDDRQRYTQVPMMSSVRPATDLSKTYLAGPAYWRANLEYPVRFSDAVASLINLDEAQVLVEIGPHPALKSPIDQILKKAGKSSIAYGSTVKRQQDGRETMLQLAGTLFCLNTEIDLAAVNAIDSVDGLEHGSIAVDLPPYQYAYGPIVYHESRSSKEYRSRKVSRHDLLGSRVAGNAKLRPQWRNILRVKDVPWLGDHRLLPDIVLPASGFVVMAIEAASRIHHEFPTPVPITGYSLRNLSIKSSLQIPEDDYGVEVMTSMELVDVATALSPAWATFSVSSIARGPEEWTEHCTGLIKVEIAEAGSASDSGLIMSSATRATDADSWYKKFTAIGLGYGSTFRPLSEIRVDPQNKNQVSAKVSLKTTAGIIKGGESSYVLHPASLDGAIQLGLIACYRGQADQASTAFVPVHFSQLYLSNTGISPDLESATVLARGVRRGLRDVHLNLAMTTSDGHEVLQVDALRCTRYSRATRSLDRAYSSPLARLLWKPDIRFLNNIQSRELFPPPPQNVIRTPLLDAMNKLAYAIVYSTYETFAGNGAAEPEPKPSGDIGHFFEWIKRRGRLDDNELRREFKRLSSEDRLAKIDEIVAQAPHVVEIQITKLLHDNMTDILAQRRTGIEITISNNLLSPMYEKGLLMASVYLQLFNVFDSLAHANPNMRYVEIGGGTGGATRIAMRAFYGPNRIKSYKDYTFTDISPSFLATAREALSGSGFDDMIYNVLDIEHDPEANGYEPIYDVAIACQVLHATSNMNRTLTNVGKLLKPGGKLVLVEPIQNFVAASVSIS